MDLRHLVLVSIMVGCGGAPASPASSPPTPAREPAAAASPAEKKAGGASGGTAEDAEPAFQTKFAEREPGYPWNPFGARGSERQVWGGPEGLWLKVARAEKAWDAVGLRTARIEIDGDFDLRAGFSDFAAPGNASAKLLVIDAKGPRGDTAYVERTQIDGKNLVKFGGEVEASGENWGFAASELSAGELRLVRRGGSFHGYVRPDNSEMWAEIGSGQAVPRSMPALVKFGLRLSVEAQKSGQVRWPWLTLRGAVVKRD
jgi:hypothetical protein